MTQRDKQGTRQALLEAARELIERHGVAELTLAGVAEAAGVTRQSVYLHFGSRAGLITAFADHVWQRAGLPSPRELVENASDARAALHALVQLRAKSSQFTEKYQVSADAVGLHDSEFQEAWRTRQEQRLAVFRLVARRIQQEGLLRAGITVETAAELMWTMISSSSWRWLVVVRGWSARKYCQHIEQSVARAVMQPE